MPTFLECIRAAVDAGNTDRARAQATQDAWQRLSDEYAERMDRRTAEELAYQDVREAFRRDTAIQRHERLSALRAMRKNVAEVEGAKDLASAGAGKLERLPGNPNNFESTRFKQDAIQEMAFGQMQRVFQSLHTDVTGGISRAKKALLDDVGRALRGETVQSQAAKDIAKAISSTNEMLRHRFNEAGGHIEKMDNWGFRQVHNWRAIQKAGPDEFMRKYAPELFDPSASPRLDWEKIENNMTGRPMSEASPEARRRFLQDIYDSGTRSIYTPIVEPRYGPAVLGEKTTAKYAHQRILHFRSYDDWKAINDAFDGPDLFSLITNHVRSMARDIALTEDFGPNARYGMEHRLQVIRKEATKKDKARGDGLDTELRAALSMEPRTRAMMAQINGLSGTPEGPRQAIIANFFSNVRGFNYASLLGSAVLASGGDFAATRLAAKTMQLNPGNVFARYTKLMASQTSRDEALRMGWVADTLADHGAGMARFVSEVPGSEFMARMTGFVMRAQGLSLHTDMLRLAVRMEMSGVLADMAGKKISDLPDAWQQRFQARGISDSDLAALTDPDTFMKAPNGATFVQPHYWMEVTGRPRAEAQRIATSITAIMEELVEASVPTRSVTGRAIIQGQSRPGTILGELSASGLSMKGFAISTWLTQYGQFMMQPTGMARAQYLASFAVWFGLMGAISLQVKELAKGNDPRPMDSTAFWAAASLQGGGLGIVGDLAAQSETRVGGLGSYLLGPVVGLTEEVARLTAGNVTQVFRGEDTNAGRELSRFIGDRTPFVSSYYGTSRAWEALVSEELQRVLDPEAAQSFRSQEQRQERNFGNQSWWGAGSNAPTRAPDLSSALGDLAP